MRLVTDSIEFATRQVPRFNPISISGYHIREAGSTAVQELAFTLRDGIEYVDWALERGLPVDSFAPGSVSFLIRTTISLRKSPNSAPRARSGPR
jgi:methylmalonyl-CoA mutase N-terminal domain/subunit